MLKHTFHVLVAGIFLLLTACSGNKEPAGQAIKSAQAAYDAAKPDALKYVPEKAQAGIPRQMRGTGGAKWPTN